MTPTTILRRTSIAAILASLSSLAPSSTALANHGPGTSGGGLATISGETLKANAWDMAFRLDYTSFDSVTAAEAEERAEASGEFDSLDSSTLANLSLNFGITDDIQVGASLGWYWGDNFIDAHFDPAEGHAHSSTADPSGLTDLWVTGKFRVMKGENGHLSFLAGVKLPTGKDDETLADGELLEPSSQPGSGSVDYLAGVAYSRYLTASVTLDASASYIFRTEHDGFTVGDRFDAGVAVSYRLTEDIGAFPNISVFGELAFTSLAKDEASGESNPNSGGNTLYLGPGIRARLSDSMALTVSPQFPVLQDLNGDQIESDFKVTAMLGFTF